MRNLLALVLSCALSNLLSAQYNYFNEVHSLVPGEASKTRNIEILDDEHCVFGQYTSDLNLPDIHLTHLDDEGNLMNWNSQSYGYIELTNYADSYIKTTDNNFLWGGGYTDNDGVLHALLSKFNTDFGIEWNYDYANPEAAEFHTGTEISGGYIGCGVVIVNENNDINDDYCDLLITKLNFDGSLAWQQIVPVFNQERFMRITKVFELVSGELMVFGGVVLNTTIEFWNWDYFAIKLDSLGNYISEYTWGGPLSDWICSWPVDLGNGEFMVAWQESHYYYQGLYYPETAVSTPHLKRFNANTMTQDWDLEYASDSLYAGYMGDLVQTPDGGFMICGNTDHLVTETDWLRSGYILKTDENGNRLWHKYLEYSADIWFLGNDDNRLWDIEITDDGGFVACGTFDEYSMGLQQIWVVKGDCMGNLALPPISFSPQITQLDDSTFYCTASGDNLYDFHWNFGNGETSEADTLTYSYEELGMFNITAYGHYCTMTVDSTFTIEVMDCQGNTITPPLGLNATSFAVNDSTFQFDCEPENLSNITWDFGDENTFAGTSTQHIYLSSGEFEVVVCGEYCDSLFCDTLLVTATVGMHEHPSQKPSFVIIPNPTTPEGFDIRGSASIHSVRVVDMIGHEILEQVANARNVYIREPWLAPGTYLVEVVFSDGTNAFGKLVVH
ncbi:MAG: PKD domain-containing protein [Flavobacteriales bacterium]|nr:PKD domain-containing protein [Flavobacteriales bacterium]